MVKYFGDAQHGQIMLQESSEVSVASPAVLIILSIIALYILVGSCLASWKFSSIDNRIEGIKWPAIQDPVDLPDTNLQLTWKDHGNRVLVVPAGTGARTWTLPKPKKGMYIRFVYGGSARTTNQHIIKTNPGIVLIGGITGSDGADVAEKMNTITFTKTTDAMNLEVLGYSSTQWILTGTLDAASSTLSTV